MNMFRKNRKGFTLIELIIVIAILAILAAIAIPMFTGITDSANKAVNQANASNIATAYNAYQALNPNTKIADGESQANIIDALKLQNLWPAGLDDPIVLGAAWDMLSFHDGICELVSTSASSGT